MCICYSLVSRHSFWTNRTFTMWEVQHIPRPKICATIKVAYQIKIMKYLKGWTYDFKLQMLKNVQIGFKHLERIWMSEISTSVFTFLQWNVFSVTNLWYQFCRYLTNSFKKFKTPFSKNKACSFSFAFWDFSNFFTRGRKAAAKTVGRSLWFLNPSCIFWQNLNQWVDRNPS